jgi:flagellin-specific chaperone FliS
MSNSGNLAKNLNASYNFMTQQLLLLVNFHNIPNTINKVCNLLANLKSAWNAITRQSQIQSLINSGDTYQTV